MPPKKRVAASNRSSAPAKKRARPIQSPVVKTEASLSSNDDDLRERFLKVFSEPDYVHNGVPNSALKSRFGAAEYQNLVPIINELTQSNRLSMGRIGKELCYNLVNENVASKLVGLDASARMVYQVVEKAGNTGVWSRDMKNQTRIQQQALTKICKALESRKLIKIVTTVSSKKVYMLYNLTPAKELTGGPWYTELEFDHEFVQEMRRFLLQCVRRLNQGQGVTLQEILDKLREANVSKVQLGLQEVQQLMQTLAYDYLVEQEPGSNLFVASRRVTPMCEFQWWDALEPDFHFRNIRFQDGVMLSAHEPHHHTA